MANGPDIDDLTVRPGAFTERGTETDPDVKEAKPLMTEFTDLENTEKALELLREKKKLLDEVAQLREADLAGREREIVIAQEQLKLLQDRDKVNQLLAVTVGQERANLEKLHNVVKQGGTQFAAYNKTLAESQNNYMNSFEALEKVRNASEQYGGSLTKTSKSSRELGREQKTLVSDLSFFTETAIGAGAAGAEAFQKMSLETQMLTGLFRDIGADRLGQQMDRMRQQYDRSFAGLARSGLENSDSIMQSFSGIMDPLGAIRRGLIDAGDASDFLLDAGINADEAGRAMGALRNNTMFMRQSFIEAQPDVAIFVGQTVAGLKKIGVAEGDSARALDQFTKILGQSPKKAASSLKQVTNIAASLDLNVGKAVKDFTNLMPKLAEFGDRAIDVFADLQAQAKATGVSVDNLNSVAMKLDTFKGAAEMAQSFNAVLGDTVLSVTDLVHAEPAEKIDMLRDAMDRSGTSFENANRRVKSMIASMLGVDVGTAARLFGSEDDFELAKQELDTTEMSRKELEERINSSMTAAEKSEKAASKMATGAEKLVRRTHRAAADFNATLSSAMDKAVESSRNAVTGIVDSEEALIRIQTMLKRGLIPAEEIKGKAAKATATGAAIAGGPGALADETRDKQQIDFEELMKKEHNRGGTIPRAYQENDAEVYNARARREDRIPVKDLNEDGKIGRQFGGSVLGGSSYMVGEAGPEMFTPNTSGMISPNSMLAAPGKGVEQLASIMTRIDENLTSLNSRLSERSDVPLEQTIQLTTDGTSLAEWVKQTSVDAIEYKLRMPV